MTSLSVGKGKLCAPVGLAVLVKLAHRQIGVCLQPLSQDPGDEIRPIDFHFGGDRTESVFHTRIERYPITSLRFESSRGCLKRRMIAEPHARPA